MHSIIILFAHWLMQPILSILFLGAIEILGGYSHHSTGGQVKIASGRSESASTGDLAIDTPDAGAGPGTSGSIKVTTGSSQQADSGSISIKTGAAHGVSGYDTQDSGGIIMEVGESDEGNGGQVVIAAGSTYSTKACKRLVLSKYLNHLTV